MMQVLQKFEKETMRGKEMLKISCEEKAENEETAA